MKTATLTLCALCLTSCLQAQQLAVTLSLDSCRSLALAGNKELRMADNRRQQARHERQAAQTKFYPRLSATGAYMYTSRELSLLSDEQKDHLNQLGTALTPLLPDGFQGAGQLDALGSGLVEALHTDTRNAGAVGLLLTQPLYMGGRIAAYNRIARYAEQAAEQQYTLAVQETIQAVDEVYWQLVSLQKNLQLAQAYLKLVQRLDADVQHLIAEGFSTRADGLSVRVKVNEAEVALIQVNNALSIAQMLLCQRCSLPLDTPVCPADARDSAATPDPLPASAELSTALLRRPELQSLSLAARISGEKVRIARSEYLPTVALTGGYMASNPSVFNSFERKMKGMWSVGVMVNVPLLTCGERRHKVQAARLEAATATLHWEETREKVELQVNRCRKKVQEAAECLATARRSCDEADENLRHAELGMREGVVPVSSVLEAQTAWLKAHTRRVASQVDLRLANLYLLKSAGTLDIHSR